MNKYNFIVRTVFVCIFYCFLFSLIILKLYEVQIVRHQELTEKAKEKYIDVKKPRGERGKIFDIEGSLLAGNMPCFEISADPSVKTFSSEANCLEIAKFFAERTGADQDKIYRRLTTKTTPRGTPCRYALIASEVDLDTTNLIRKEIAEKKWQGISFKSKTKRFYPYNELLANIIGFVNVDAGEEKAQSGIEQVTNKSITPEDGKIIVERDRKGTPFTEYEIQKKRDGNDIYLTVMQRIQLIVEEELDNLVAKFAPKSAYAVMVNPYNGNIIAIAQRPTFNPNDRSTMNDPFAIRDRVISDVYEPGSIMKAIPIAGALDNNVVKPTDTFFCENGFWFYAGKRLKDVHPYGTLTVNEILQKSSNIGTAKISLAMGEKKLYKVLHDFGFGQKTGLPIRSESSGIFRPLKQWDALSVTRFCIGQGIAVTPLQIVRAYCAIANGGYLVKLRLLDREVNPTTGEVYVYPIEEPKKIIMHDKTIEQIKHMLTLVTKKGGTAERAAIKGYEVAGKTGTSQKAEGGQYVNKYYSSFIGFVPSDKPAFVLLVTAEEPKGAHYGGIVAAPIFKNIAEKTLRALNIPPQHPEELEEETQTSNEKS